MIISTPSDGIALVTNSAGTDFTRFQFGGTTSSFPAITRNGVVLEFRLADASALTGVYAATYGFGPGAPRIYSGAGSPEGVITAVVGSFYLRSDGGAGTSVYVKESGTGNTGWTAK